LNNHERQCGCGEQAQTAGSVSRPIPVIKPISERASSWG
jgi:hypothetical protein